MDSTRYLHSAGCSCRACTFPRPRSSLYEPAMRAAVGALSLVAFTTATWCQIKDRHKSR